MTFKVGDKVERLTTFTSCDKAYIVKKGQIYTVTDAGTAWVALEGKSGYRYTSSEFRKVEKPVPHKHADLIKAWADGAKIEGRTADTNEYWTLIGHPQWHEHWQYRIKPEPKPDVVVYGRMKDYVQELDEYPQVTDIAHVKSRHDNLKFIFDGETGKLKAAEVVA